MMVFMVGLVHVVYIWNLGSTSGQDVEGERECAIKVGACKCSICWTFCGALPCAPLSFSKLLEPSLVDASGYAYDTSVCYPRCIKVHVDETGGGTKANQREREREKG